MQKYFTNLTCGNYDSMFVQGSKTECSLSGSVGSDTFCEFLGLPDPENTWFYNIIFKDLFIVPGVSDKHKNKKSRIRIRNSLVRIQIKRKILRIRNTAKMD